MKANIFNVGSLRRKVAVGKQSFDFFDAQNAAAKQQREELAYSALDMALEWLGACLAAVLSVSWCLLLTRTVDAMTRRQRR